MASITLPAFFPHREVAYGTRFFYDIRRLFLHLFCHVACVQGYLAQCVFSLSELFCLALMTPLAGHNTWSFGHGGIIGFRVGITMAGIALQSIFKHRGFLPVGNQSWILLLVTADTGVVLGIKTRHRNNQH